MGLYTSGVYYYLVHGDFSLHFLCSGELVSPQKATLQVASTETNKVGDANMQKISLEDEYGYVHEFECEDEYNCFEIVDDGNGNVSMVAKKCDDCGDCDDSLPCDYCDTHECIELDYCPYGN